MAELKGWPLTTLASWYSICLLVYKITISTGISHVSRNHCIKKFWKGITVQNTLLYSHQNKVNYHTHLKIGWQLCPPLTVNSPARGTPPTTLSTTGQPIAQLWRDSCLQYPLSGTEKDTQRWTNKDPFPPAETTVGSKLSKVKVIHLSPQASTFFLSNSLVPSKQVRNWTTSDGISSTKKADNSTRLRWLSNAQDVAPYCTRRCNDCGK